MFFNNYLIFIFLKFLYAGLIFGIFKIFCNFAVTLSKRNLYVSNVVSFCFWIAFGMVYALMSLHFYNFSFCWFGLLGMALGLVIIKFSIDFFFTIFAKLLYNRLGRKKLGSKHNGRLQPNEEN